MNNNVTSENINTNKSNTNRAGLLHFAGFVCANVKKKKGKNEVLFVISSFLTLSLRTTVAIAESATTAGPPRQTGRGRLVVMLLYIKRIQLFPTEL